MATCELHPDELFDPQLDGAYAEFMHQTEDDVAVVDPAADWDDDAHPEPDDVYADFVGRTEA
jgi:hypothetical protein